MTTAIQSKRFTRFNNLEFILGSVLTIGMIVLVLLSDVIFRAPPTKLI